MARKKLTIVVTCTDRKVTTARPALQVRTLPSGPLRDRVQEWRTRLNQERATIPLVDLYRGETWTQVKRLIATARAAGYSPDVLVASAGLGLRRVGERSPAYAATFGKGHADSVANSVEEAQAWWSELPHTAAPAASQPSLWVLSEAYARVVTPTLGPAELGTALVFGGSTNVPDEIRIPTDVALRRALGGTVTSLNVRMAIRWLELAERGPLIGESTRLEWEKWRRSVRHTEHYDRTPLSDDAVREFIVTLASKEPGLSKTRALQRLRASGLACEQRRFSNLFGEVVTQ